MVHKLSVLHQMIGDMTENPWLSAKLRCGDGYTLNLGIEAIKSLIKHFENVTNCSTCPDADMCDQVKYDCPKWYG